MSRHSEPTSETASRRDVLVAAGGVAAGGLLSTDVGRGSTPSTGAVTVARDRTLDPVSDEFEGSLRRTDVDLSTDATDVEEGVERFLAGETDVLHARRPLLPGEATTAAENGVAYEAFESVVDDVALLSVADGWRSCVSDDELTALRDANPGGETWVELVSGDTSALDEVEGRGDGSPRAAAAVAVRGVRRDQYAVGRGGLGYYRVRGEEMRAAESVDDASHTPLAQLRYTYVNADRWRRDLAAFVGLFATYARRRRRTLRPYPDAAGGFDTFESSVGDAL